MWTPFKRRGTGVPDPGFAGRWAAVILLTAVSAILSTHLLSKSDARMTIEPIIERSTSSSAILVPDSAYPVMNSRAVIKRLEDIFRIQDQAFRNRDETLLTSVFSADCGCLDAGQRRIRRLRDERLRWVGYRSRVSDAHATRTDNRTWTVSAAVSATTTRVETESHQLLRIIPASTLQWRFVLTQPSDGGPLLLLDAEAAP